ncbi:unnamed protein product [Linum tenue]|uniref:non-specific serine/threonine protein kinase n=4 Tax=Linum tenue TaxID=586396 RepID=A0AAV0NFN1_9ROSI|nr:unnamed protein product [Linum tenue]
MIIATMVALSGFLIMLSLTAGLDALSFSYSSFDQCSDSIKLYGEASCMNSGIQLTGFGYYVIGQARYSKPMPLWDATTGSVANFTTTFIFEIASNNNSSCCDGLAFFLAPQNYSIPVGGGASGGLGLIYANLTYDSASENPFVAVEFDTYNNEWDSWNGSSHVGIDINSLQSVASKRWRRHYNGKGTRRMRARISYDKDANTLCASWFSSRDNSGQFKFDDTLCYGVDLTHYLPEQVVFGFSSSTAWRSQSHTISSWSFSSSNLVTATPTGSSARKDRSDGENGHLTMGLLIGMLLAGLALVAVWFCVCRRVCWRRNADQSPLAKRELLIAPLRGGSQGQEQDITSAGSVSTMRGPRLLHRINPGAKYISPEAVRGATNNFSEMLGRGGFGAVYKGELDGRDIAVKKLFQVTAARGNKEGYMAELTVISQLRHHNLVELLGWSCDESGDLYLVYEYMENGSLDDHLRRHGPGQQPLTWEIRFRIAKDLGSGLLYLHGGCTECVLHRDIKPANVLLDSRLRAKLSDFGLARVVGHDDRSQSLISGSEGYLAHEVLETGKSTKHSDVFSFGVVALQIVSGKPAYVINNSTQRRHIVEWAWGLYGEGHVQAVVDPKLHGVFVEEQVRLLVQVALHCTHPDPSLRPPMKDVMDALNVRPGLPPLPLQYPIRRSSQAELLPSLSRILEQSQQAVVSSLQQQPVPSGVVPPAQDQIGSFDQPVTSVLRAQAAASRLYCTV